MKRPKALTRKERDEAYLRTLQVDLEEDIALSAQEPLRDTISPEAGEVPGELTSSLPASCPACGAGVVTGRPDIWTHMSLHTPTAERPNFEYRVQCGQCGLILRCTSEAWDEAQRIRHEYHNRFKRTAPKKEKRERGAE